MLHCLDYQKLNNDSSHDVTFPGEENTAEITNDDECRVITQERWDTNVTSSNRDQLFNRNNSLDSANPKSTDISTVNVSFMNKKKNSN